MDATHDQSQSCFNSFSCEIKISQAKDIEFTSSKTLFVRYYLSVSVSAGRNQKRVGLNTKEISSKSDFFWNESFSLDCSGTEHSIQTLKQQTLVFELRQAKTLPNILGRIAGSSSSQLLGTFEIPWKQVFESPNMVIDKWVSLVWANASVRKIFNFKQPKLNIGMTVGFTEKMEEKVQVRRSKSKEWHGHECGCKSDMSGHNCADYETFVAMATVMEFI